MIICSDHQEAQKLSRQDPAKLNEMINAYKRKRVSDPGKIKSYGLCDYWNDRKNKTEDELAKVKKRNLEAKFPTSVECLDSSSEEQLRDFAYGLGIQIDEVGSKMPLLNPNPMITMMTHFDHNYNDNTSIVSDNHVESSGSSNSTNVDNGYYPIVPMDQIFFGTDQRLMEALNMSSMKSEDVNDCYDGPKFDLKPEKMQQLEQPQSMDMQRLMLSCFY
ncbi:hypothetical protein CTI12_AA617940 [Artemisia annua]|uniref:Uncharacterized protein n=1 Tax=Artemisia annua TaxID=35608 RepID=A0A2U1KCR3_ARTAN|nr:hypothetical protein CTI12_AA617940 [Artemisia annua]